MGRPMTAQAAVYVADADEPIAPLQEVVFTGADHGQATARAQSPADGRNTDIASRLGSGDRFQFEHLAHPLDELLDLERLVEEVVGARGPQVADLVVLDHA